MVKVLLRSLCIVGLVSCALGTSVYLFFKHGFWGTTILATLFQLGIGALYNHITLLIVTNQKRKEETLQLTELAKQSLNLSCAHCKTENRVPIRLDIDNTFECPKCKNNNAVYIEVKTAQITEPIQIDPTQDPVEQLASKTISQIIPE